MSQIIRLERSDPTKALLVEDRQGKQLPFEWIEVYFLDGSTTAAQRIGGVPCCPNCEKFFKAFDDLDAIYHLVEIQKEATNA